MNSSKGFTLAELLIVTLIIGVLASISYTYFGDHVRSSNRTEARAALSQTAGLLEKCRSLYGRYDNNNCSTVGLVNSRFNTESDFYEISADTLEPTNFIIRATPLGVQTGDVDCTWLTLSNTGLKAGSNLEECW